MASRGTSRGRSIDVRRGGKSARTRAPPGGGAAASDGVGGSRRRFDLSDTRLRWFAARPNFSAALLLALPVLVYLWPALVGGKILSPLTMLYEVPPWQNSVPPDVASYTNILLSDIAMAVYPWRSFAREMLHSGTLPIWNPHTFSGVPFWSNPQNGLFTPFNLPLWVLPLNYALGLSAALKLWAGAFGTYLLARQLRLGFLPGLLGGVAFAFSSLNIVWLTHETLPAVAVMLPWMLWLVERIFERGRLGSALGLAVATAIAIGGGHPGMQVHVIAAVGLYAILRAAFSGDDGGSLGERLRPVAFVAGGLVAGALLMAVMLVPEMLASRDTIGVAARQGARGTLPGTEMPFVAAKSILFPDWWGRPSAFEVEVALPNYNERTFYPGVVALLFALVAVVAQGGWRRKGPFAVLAVLGIAIPLHAPGLWWLVTNVPPFDLVQNQRLHFLWAFAIAVLAAFGLQALMERPAEERWRLLVPLAAVLGGFVALSSAGAAGGDAGHVFKHFLTGTDFPTPGVVALTSIAWFLLFAVGVGAALALAVWRPQWAVALGVAVVLLAAFDALHFAHGYQPMGPASKVIPPKTPAIEYLQAHRDEGRIAGLNYAVTQDWSLVYGLNDVRGYDPPYPTRRFYALWRVAEPQQLDWQPFLLTSLDASTVKVTAALGARFIVTGPGGEEPPDDDSGLGSLRRVYSGDDATVYRNAAVAPRAMVAASVKVAADEDEARALMVEEGFDPRRTAVVERGEGGAALDGGADSGSAPAPGTVSVVGEDNTRVRLQASMKRKGLVVLNDQLTRGWSVQVDGRDAAVVRVNDVMRGVEVPAGAHEVEWRYSMPGLLAGFVVSLLALVGLVGVALLPALRRRG